MQPTKTAGKKETKSTRTGQLQRKLGFAAVASIVAGDMMGSGIFFTPGELASVISHHWQAYFFWGLAGIITLCGALTLAELSSKIPESGSSFYIIRNAYGPFWGFLKIWTEMWIGGPVSVAGLAIVFGQFFTAIPGINAHITAPVAGVVAILVFALINLMGVQWGGRTQILLTTIKVGAILGLIVGSVFWVQAASTSTSTTSATIAAATPLDFSGLWQILRVMGLGIAAVLFTYDGWIDVTHTAGEVSDPERNLPRGLYFGVGAIIVVYLLVNYSFLRIVPMEQMRSAPTLVASTVATKTFGPAGGSILTGFIIISIFGSLGGLIMTIPRLYFGAAVMYEKTIQRNHPAHFFFKQLSTVSAKSLVPVGSILFSALISCVALLAFRSFGRLANLLVVPLQLINILLVASIFRLRGKMVSGGYRTPGYPVVPLIYIVVMAMFLLSAIYFNPVDTLLGIAIMGTAVPVYFWINQRKVNENR